MERRCFRAHKSLGKPGSDPMSCFPNIRTSPCLLERSCLLERAGLLLGGCLPATSRSSGYVPASCQCKSSRCVALVAPGLLTALSRSKHPHVVTSSNCYHTGLQGKLPPKGLLWELIYPQDGTGKPVKTASGKYHVKCFVMDEWRRVTVDDQIPVDAFGSPLLVGSMPAQLWPLILSKAIIKVMALYQVQ